jgi:hypothetical protein
MRAMKAIVFSTLRILTLLLAKLYTSKFVLLL